MRWTAAASFGRLLLLVAAAAAGGALAASTPHSFVVDAALAASLPVSDLLLRAHRMPVARSLDADVVCTSLSGPGCLAGAAVAPSAWAWQRNETKAPPDHLTPWLQPSLSAGRVFAWGFVGSVAAFDARLALGDTLVLFFSRSCTECERAAAAVRDAALLLLRDAPLRYLAVGCDEGSPTAAVCSGNVVGRVPQLRLFYGSRISVRMDPQAMLRAINEDADEDEDDDDEDEEEEDEDEEWSARTVAAFYRASTTPETRAKLQTAQSLLASFLGGSKQSALSRRLAADLGDDDEEEDDDDDEAAAAGAAARSRSKQVLQALGQLIAGRREAGDEAAAAAFHDQVDSLLRAHDKGGIVAAGEGGDALPSQTRSLASRVRRYLQVVNARTMPIDVKWVDFSGIERKFSRVDPGRSVKLATFTQHLWRVSDVETGKLITTVVVRERQSKGEGEVYRVVVV